MHLSWPSPARLALVLALAWAAYVVFWTPGPPSLRLLGFYPKKLGSRVVGWAATRALPTAWRRPLLGRFAAHYGIDLAEAEGSLGDYPSFQAFFTRRLKPGLRPQASEVPGFINSPVDGCIIASGPCHS